MKFEDVETARKIYFKKSQKCLLVSAGIAIALGVIASISSRESIFQGIVFAVIMFTFGAGIAIFLTRKEATAYKKAYKAYFVEQNLHKIFTDVVYDHQKGLPSSWVSATDMINTGDIFSSNDLTMAKYKKIGFTQADATIQTVSTDSDGNTTYTTIFKGRFMIFEFPKKFDFKLELIGKRFHAYQVPGKDKSTGRKMERKETESTEFNRAFKIYGQDGFETSYLLNPAMIAKLKDISTFYKNRVLIGFYDNKMLVAINDGKDSFEPPRPTRPINESEEMQKVASSIKVITDFVDIISSH